MLPFTTLTANVVPSTYKATMQVQYDPLNPADPNTTYSVDQTFDTADIYTKRLTLWFGAQRRATLFLDGSASVPHQGRKRQERRLH